MKVISLQSGSNGNCLYVETNGTRLLFDAGISASLAAERLASHGRDIKDVDALIISHDHGDHVRHAGVYHRKFDLPVYITPGTLDRALSRHNIGKGSNIMHFSAGEEIKINGLSIQTIPSPHDCLEGSVFVISSNGKRLGIITDIGHVFNDLHSIISSLDAVFIESNYDTEMLIQGSYPTHLKKRIQGPEGHLSNRESAELLLAGVRLKWACLAHISKNNNSPSTALRTHREVLGNDLTLYVASRKGTSEILVI